MNTEKDFERLLDQMRNRNPQTAEDAFGALGNRAAEFKDHLLAEFERACAGDGADAPQNRCGWLLELLSGIGHPDLQPLFETELTHPERRCWAIRGLEKIDTTESRRVLWTAGEGA